MNLWDLLNVALLVLAAFVVIDLAFIGFMWWVNRNR